LDDVPLPDLKPPDSFGRWVSNRIPSIDKTRQRASRLRIWRVLLCLLSVGLNEKIGKYLPIRANNDRSRKNQKRERDASLRDLWRTPQWLFVAIQRYIGVKFDVDVACNKDNALLPNFIGVERDALKCSWGEPGTVAFLNPPYSKITPG
jgi:hypothetical protein